MLDGLSSVVRRVKAALLGGLSSVVRRVVSLIIEGSFIFGHGACVNNSVFHPVRSGRCTAQYNTAHTHT